MQTLLPEGRESLESTLCAAPNEVGAAKVWFSVRIIWLPASKESLTFGEELCGGGC